MEHDDHASPRLRELLHRLARIEAELAEADDRRSAADERLTWALMRFATLARIDEARGQAGVYAALDEIVGALLAGCRQAVYLLGDRQAELRLVHARERHDGLPDEITLGEGFIGRAAAERRAITGTTGQRAAVAVPLGVPPTLIGAVVVHWELGGPGLDVDSLQLVDLMARHAGNRLHVLSCSDAPP